MYNSDFDVWEDMSVMRPVLGAGSLRWHRVSNTLQNWTCLLYLRAGVLGGKRLFCILVCVPLWYSACMLEAIAVQ